MFIKHLTALGVSFCVMADFLCYSVPAAAQSVSADQRVLEEVVITSTKRTELLDEVPTDATVVNKDAIQTARATNVADLGYGVTGVFIDSQTGGSAATTVSMRGVSGNAELTGVRSGIGFFADGTDVFNQTAFNLPLLDVDRVEILKGPQPAAFSRSVIGGAINVISALPPSQASITGNLSYGNYNSKQSWVTVGGPLMGDDLRMSVSGLLLTHDGYLRNLTTNGVDADSADVAMGKLNVLYQPTSQLRVHFVGDYYQDLGFSGPAQCTVLAYGCSPLPLTDRVLKSFDGPYRDTTVKNESARVLADYTLNSGFIFSSVTAYRYNKAAQVFDILNNGGGTEFANYRDNGSWEGSQELRFSSPSTGKLTYLFGVLWDHEHLNFSIPFIVPRNVPQPEFPFLTRDLILDDGMHRATNVASLFGSGRATLSERLKLDVGLRLSHESTTAESVQRVVDGAGLSDQAAAATYYGFNLFDLTRSQSWNNFEWQVAPSFQLTPDSMVYTRVSQGKKSGGFTQLIILSASTITDPAFGPETLTSYEVGSKGSLLHGRVHWNADVFYNDYRDIQARFQTTETFGIRVIRNVGTATSSGFEFETTLSLSQYVSLLVGVTYEPSKFTTAVPEISIAKGNEFENLPRWLGNLSLNAEYPVSAHAKWFGNVSGGTRSRSYLDDQNVQSQDPNTILNARTGIDWNNGKLKVAGWVKNLTNRYVETFAYTNFNVMGVPAVNVIANAPRTFGVEVGFQL